MNPALELVGNPGRVWILAKNGKKYYTDVNPKHQRMTVIREANTNGVWCWEAWNLNQRLGLTYLNNSAILGFEFRRNIEFPEEGN